MAKPLYFAAFFPPDGPEAVMMGFGFSPSGAPRNPQEAPHPGWPIGLDDRNLPLEPEHPGLMAAAEQAPWILCDFEQRPNQVLVELLTKLPAEKLVVPESYASLSDHGKVLAAPYVPVQDAALWAEKKRQIYGDILVDMRPVDCSYAPGRDAVPEPCRRPQGKTPWYNRHLCCMCAGGEDGGAPVFYFYDTKKTVFARMALWDLPGIILSQEFQRLPDDESGKGQSSP